MMIRVRERYAVGSPFGKQENEQRHCEIAAQIPTLPQVSNTVLHNSGSLAISFYAGNEDGFQIIRARKQITKTHENTICSPARKIELG